MHLRVLSAVLAASAAGAWAAPAWVEASDRHARQLLAVHARFRPEFASQQGVDSADTQIADMTAGAVARYRTALGGEIARLETALKAEKDALVRQDLRIMIDSAREDVRELELNERLPYFAAPRIAYFGLQLLLDDRSPAARREKALPRLRKYAGMDPGATPMLTLARDRVRERLKRPDALLPSAMEVDKDLAGSQFLMRAIAESFAKHKIEGYQEPYAKLLEQVKQWDEFVRAEIRPKARNDFRLPRELYDFQLTKFGVDIPAEKLAAMAHAAFSELQAEMAVVARQVAAARGWEGVTDYREVIRRLKKDQLARDRIMPTYQERLAQIEAIVRRENLVTLPDRPARMRLGTEAESAAQPAPHMRPPRLIGNQGESGEFVLPLGIGTGKDDAYDDFSFEAATWTLTAHEARPGHEMQFAAMVERGVSIARAVFAFNSTNAEGWGLYSEWLIKPFMPPDGQLMSLQARLMRAARAFLDPELHVGKVTREQAMAVLLNDVGLSKAMATQEVERYMFRAPAQATSYFYGFTRLLEVRREVEKKLGPKFNAREFHDFILAQGLLPPALLRAAVEEKFLGK